LRTCPGLCHLSLSITVLPVLIGAGLPGVSGQAAATSPPGRIRRVPAEAYDAYGKAVLARLRGDRPASLKFLKEALRGDPGSATVLKEIASHYQRAGERKKAVEHYLKALDRDPDDIRSHAELGQLYFRMRKTGLAIKHLEKAARLQPGDLRTGFLLANLYRVARRLPECARAYEAVLRDHPRLVRTSEELAKVYQELPKDVPALRKEAEESTGTDFIPYFRLGRALMEKKDFRAATEAFETATRIEPRWYHGLETLGRLYQVLDRFDEAVEAYSRVAESHPDRAMLLYIISGIHYDRKEFAKAVNVLEEIRSARPKHGDALLRLATCHYLTGNPRKAIEVGEEYLKLEAKEVDYAVYRMLGTSYAEIGQKAKAYECAAQIAAAIEKTQDDEHYALLSRMSADVLAAIDDRKQAILLLEDAARRTPKHRELLLDLAALYDEEKLDDKVEQVLKGVIEREPQNHRALNHLGYFYAERGKNLQEAIALIQAALKAEPRNWAYLDSLGWAYFRLGRQPEALEKLQEAITIHDDPILREHLGSVYRAAGDRKKAREQWLRALELDPKREELKQRIEELGESATEP